MNGCPGVVNGKHTGGCCKRWAHNQALIAALLARSLDGESHPEGANPNPKHPSRR